MQPRSRALLVIAFLLISISCENNEKELIDIPFETKPFNIKIGADGINSHFRYFMAEENGKPILYYYDYLLKKITLIDFEDKKILKHININDDKYKLKGVSHIFKKDSLYLIRNIDYFYWIDESGEIIRYYDARGFNNDSSEDKRILRPSEVLNSNGKNLSYHVVSRKANHDKGYLESLRLANYNFDNQSIESLTNNIFGSGYVKEEETMAYISNPFLLTLQDSHIIHFPFTADFQIINLSNNTSEIMIHDVYKSDIPDVNPITHKELVDLNYSMKLDKLHQQVYYYPLIYDEFRELYYRPYRLKVDLEFEDMADFSMNLLVYDNSIELLGQLNLGNIYMPVLYITRDAVYIRKKDQRESYIEMDELIFEVD